MKNNFSIPALASALLLVGVSSLSAGLSGAIFTTDSTGTVVNGNQYNSPCSVYLDGGPGVHAPAHAAGLPDGTYYFQVTDPSGQQLLSTDIVMNRSFQVSGGVIVAYTGVGGPVHVTGPDQVDPQLGAITIRLANLTCPTDFAATSNNGGAYKVWVTSTRSFVGDPTQVDNSCGNGCFHGFVPSASKTDNFKVDTAAATFCLTIEKLFFQGNNSPSTPVANWSFTVTDPLSVTNQFFTDSTGQIVVCDMAPGQYTVAEDPSSSVYSLTVNNSALSPATSTPFTWAVGQPGVGIVFVNQTALPALPN
jgi:hypothetical protein